jgi:hypothetical protein
MKVNYSYIFLFLFLTSLVYTQDSIHVAETNIDFSRLPDVVIQKKDSLPYSGLVSAECKNGNIQYEFTYLDGNKNGPCRA